MPISAQCGTLLILHASPLHATPAETPAANARTCRALGSLEDALDHLVEYLVHRLNPLARGRKRIEILRSG